MRPSSRVFLLTVLTAAVVAWAVVAALTPKGGGRGQSVYQHVISTGMIRCGYIVYPPYLYKDPNTGQMSGAAYDFMQEIGRELNVKIDWTEETGWGTFQEGLNGGRYDLMCVPVWQSGGRARVALLTQPLFYDSLFAFARADDHRFDKNPESINKAGLKVMVVDGDPTQEVRRVRFPLTEEVALTQSADQAQGPVSLVTGKVDIWLDNPVNVERFNAGSGKKLRIVAGGQPLRTFGDVLAIKLGEQDFKAALDAVIQAIHDSGASDSIVQRYAPGIQAHK